MAKTKAFDATRNLDFSRIMTKKDEEKPADNVKSEPMDEETQNESSVNQTQETEDQATAEEASSASEASDSKVTLDISALKFRKKQTKKVRKGFLITEELNEKFGRAARELEVSENALLNEILKQVLENF